MMDKNKLFIEQDEEVPEYWRSFSDMMAGLLMIFILFLTIAMLQLNIQEDLLQDKEEEVNRIIGVRQKIVEELKREFENSDLQLNIDPESGAISFVSGKIKS